MEKAIIAFIGIDIVSKTTDRITANIINFLFGKDKKEFIFKIPISGDSDLQKEKSRFEKYVVFYGPIIEELIFRIIPFMYITNTTYLYMISGPIFGFTHLFNFLRGSTKRQTIISSINATIYGTLLTYWEFTFGGSYLISILHHCYTNSLCL